MWPILQHIPHHHPRPSYSHVVDYLLNAKLSTQAVEEVRQARRGAGAHPSAGGKAVAKEAESEGMAAPGRRAAVNKAAAVASKIDEPKVVSVKPASSLDNKKLTAAGWKNRQPNAHSCTFLSGAGVAVPLVS